jgi:hypothetical protein
MLQLLYQLVTLCVSTISFVFHPTNLWKMITFLFRKLLLYLFFGHIAVAILLKYYFDYIPNMSQSVILPFKQVNEELKYFAFAFERNYKM